MRPLLDVKDHMIANKVSLTLLESRPTIDNDYKPFDTVYMTRRVEIKMKSISRKFEVWCL